MRRHALDASLPRRETVVYKGYLIKPRFIDGWFVEKDGFSICSEATVEAAKATIDKLV